MRIRSGFVSNSSSTSFLIICKGELTEEAFLKLMGISGESPLRPIFVQLFEDVIEQTSVQRTFRPADKRLSVEEWFESERISEKMKERLRDAKGKGLTAYFGMLSSDNTPVQTFFCTDSFEVEDDQIYFNALECVW